MPGKPHTLLRRWLRRATRVGLSIVAVIGLLLLPASCTTTIVAPPTPGDPVSVYLLDHGRTPSIVLPTSPDRMYRYAYGDWQWYALVNTGFFSGLAALLIPTQGTLGRQEILGPPTVETIRAEVPINIDHIYAIPVSAERVRQLHQRLEAEFDANREHMVGTGQGDLAFVPHPQRYTYFRNSNHVAARWLADLGCQLRGPAFGSRWRVRAPSDR